MLDTANDSAPATTVEVLSLSGLTLTVRIAGAEHAVELDSDLGRPYFHADYALGQGADLDVVEALLAVDEAELQDAIDRLYLADRFGEYSCRAAGPFALEAS